MAVFLRKKIKIMNPQGLHARPASTFVKIAGKYESDVTVKKGRETVDGKSIMGLMMLAASQGTLVELQVSGPDAEAAMMELEHFLLGDQE